MTARCFRRRWNGPLLCSMPATVLLIAACVHEHISESPYCDHHADEIRDGAPRVCVPCGRSSQPHNCVVRVIAEDALPAEAAS